MTNADNETLEGKTLSVYSYVVKEGKPVGPREVMRGANLSSPSVAYWHLQKLEACGLLEKNSYGEYVLKEKVNISGHLWIGRNLVPRLMCYSLFFMGVVGTELVIIASQFFLHGTIPSADLIYLAATNAIATALFLGEGFLLWRKNKPEKHEKKSPVNEGPASGPEVAT
ncbi:MAG: hypothetical protein ACE14S_12050 [Candidatus Bathyarchaeia archaeon]